LPDFLGFLGIDDGADVGSEHPFSGLQIDGLTERPQLEGW